MPEETIKKGMTTALHPFLIAITMSLASPHQWVYILTSRFFAVVRLSLFITLSLLNAVHIPNNSTKIINMHQRIGLFFGTLYLIMKAQ